jgi:methyl-accepting chemotaxis protein
LPFALNSVKARLMAGFAVILALLLGVATLSVLRMRQADQAARQVEQVVLPTRSANEQLAVLMQRYRTLEYAHLGALVPEDHPAIEAIMAKLLVAMKPEFERLAAHPELQVPAIQDAPKSWQAYTAYFDDAIRRDSHDGMANIAIRRMAGEHEKQFDQLMGTLEANSQRLRDAVVTSSQEGQAMRAQAQWVILAATLLALLSGAAIAAYTARQITVPLHRTIGFAHDIAQGNLAAQLDGRADGEMLQLVQALQTMRDRLDDLVRQARDGVTQVQTASGEIASSGIDLSTRTEQQASHVTAAASTLTTLTDDIRQASAATDQAQQLAEGSVKQATQTGQLMHEVIDGMAGITQTTVRIGEIVQSIDAIAFQTNILALNAAVEAACAGEHGRGFAVVAAEVRALAQRCATAAKDIKVLAEDARQRVRQGEGSTRSANEAVAAIGQQIHQIAGFIAQLSTQSHQQLDQLEYVHQSVLVIDDMTQRNAALSEESAAAATSLRDQAEALGRSVAQFRLHEA